MNFDKVRLACRKRGVKYDGKCYNSVRFHNTNETLTHFMAKARICKHLFDKGHSFFTEFAFKNSVADIYDIDADFVIEIQGDMSLAAVTKKQEQFKGHELWLLPLSDFEKDFEGALGKWLKRMGLHGFLF